MKKHFKSLALCAVLIAVLGSCKKKEDPAPQGGSSNPSSRLVTKNVTKDTTWTSSEDISLGGYVYVKSGATLTIQAGTKIESTIIQSALIVEPGAKIIAIGTASSPIVFTSGNSNPRRGDWAGLVICGNAMTNNYTSTQPLIEGGLATKYGSQVTANESVNADNSGTLSYVRIEYAGYAPIPGSELNGLSLYAVGSGTTINHVEVIAANDDSFEWFGGTVNCDHLIAYMGLDDDFDTDNGYSGHVQFGLGVRSQYIADQSGSKAFESDHDGSANANGPQTLCKFSNMTVVGPVNSMGNLATSVAPAKNAATYVAAMHTRRNSSISLVNSIIIGWPTGILIDGKSGTSGVTNANYVDGTKGVIKNNIIAGISKNFKANGTSAGTDLRAYDVCSVKEGLGDLTVVDPVKIADSTQLAWASYATGPKTFAYNVVNGNKYQYDFAGILVNPFAEFNPSTYDFRLAPSSPAASGADFTGLPSDFTTVSYIGAFSTTDWTSGWASFPMTNNQ